MASKHPNEGRELSAVYWPDAADGSERILRTSQMRQLRFHVDSGGHWVIELQGGVEKRRHNCRFVESLIWIDD